MMFEPSTGSGNLIERPDLLHHIEMVMDEVKGSKGAFLLLAGEAGVGKTVLAQSTGTKASAMGWTVAVGECRFGDKGDPYRPMAQALQGLIDRGPSMMAPLPRPRVRSRTDTDYMPMGLSALLIGGHPDGTGSMNPGPDIGMERERLFDNVAGLIGKASEMAPVLIILDDVHLSSNAMLQMLLHLARSLKERRTLFLGTYTPEEVAARGKKNARRDFSVFMESMEKDRLSRTIPITGLTVQETGQMLERLLPRNYPDGLVTRIQKVSEGNPYLISEFAKGISRKDVSFVLDEIELPRTISEMLRQRIDSLDDGARTVVEYGAVVGNRFGHDVLKASTRMEDKDIVDALDTLVETRILERTQAGGGRADPIYVFRNNIMREIIYKDLSLTKKRHTHKKVASAIESLYGNKGDVYDLAYHSIMAGDIEKGFDASLAAGEKALNSYAVNEAYFYFKKALGMLEKLQGKIPDAKVAKLNILMARVLPAKGHVDEALDLLSKAISLSKNDGPSKAMANLQMGYILTNKDERRKALENFKEAVRLSKNLGDRSMLAEAFLGLAKVLAESGSHEQTLKYCQKAIEQAEAVGNRRLVARTYNVLGGSYCENKGDYETALECLLNAVDNTDPEADGMMLGDLNNNIAYVKLRMGDYEEALPMFEKAMATAERTGASDLRAYGLAAIGETLIRMGRPFEAKPYLEKAIPELKKMQNLNVLSMAYMSMGMLYNSADEFERAEKWFKDALAIQGRESMPFNRAIIHYEYGKALKAHCQDVKAIKNFKVALIILKKLGYKLYIERTMQELRVMGAGKGL